jgi:hypothetical protein
MKRLRSILKMRMEGVKKIPPPVAPRVRRNPDLLASLTKTRPHGPKRTPPSRATLRRHHSHDDL